MNNHPAKLSPATLAELQAIEPGYVDPALFNQLTRLAVVVALECVPLRLNAKGEVEALLTLRPETDLHWPGLYHNPGTVLRPTDSLNSLESAKQRLLTDELSGITITSPWFFQNLYLMSAGRGTNLGIVSWIEAPESPHGTYFAIDQLPENIITELVPYVKQCAEAYKRYKDGNFTPHLLDGLFA